MKLDQPELLYKYVGRAFGKFLTLMSQCGQLCKIVAYVFHGTGFQSNEVGSISDVHAARRLIVSSLLELATQSHSSPMCLLK